MNWNKATDIADKVIELILMGIIAVGMSIMTFYILDASTEALLNQDSNFYTGISILVTIIWFAIVGLIINLIKNR